MAQEETQVEAQPEAQTLEAGDFSALLEKEFRPKSDRAREARPRWSWESFDRPRCGRDEPASAYFRAPGPLSVSPLSM